MAASKLKDYINQLQDPIPQFKDPEDFEDGSAAYLAPHEGEGDEEEASTQGGASALRRRAAAFLDLPEGKKTSRKELYGDSGSEDNASLDSWEEEMEDEGDEEKSDDDVNDEELEGGEESEDEEVASDEDEEEELQDDAANEEITSAESEEEENVVIEAAAVDEGEKAEAVVQQLDLWDRLMEARIQLQKVLCLVNRLTVSAQNKESPSLCEAREVLEETNYTLNEVQNGTSSPRKRKADMETAALESYQSLTKARNTTLTFWDEKTRLASKKFKSFKSHQTPVVKQVEQILSDRDRLVRRTQVLRDSDAAEAPEKPEEVFDDNDFYQRLLKNLIETKAAEDSSVSVSASHWLEVQRLRGKKKKKKDIDTRASKGRKLRYNVHSKLVNFMVPRDDSTWSEDARNELFKNLFKMPSHPEM